MAATVVHRSPGKVMATCLAVIDCRRAGLEETDSRANRAGARHPEGAFRLPPR